MPERYDVTCNKSFGYLLQQRPGAMQCSPQQMLQEIGEALNRSQIPETGGKTMFAKHFFCSFD